MRYQLIPSVNINLLSHTVRLQIAIKRNAAVTWGLELIHSDSPGFAPIPRPERCLVTVSLRSARFALRADALKRSRSQLANLAPFLSAERTEPSVSHLLNGPDDFVRYGFNRPNPVTLSWPLGLGVQKSPELHQRLGFGLASTASSSASCFQVSAVSSGRADSERARRLSSA
jgi:hypothetical protein